MTMNKINKKVYSLKAFNNLYGVSSKKLQNLSVTFGLNLMNKDFKLKKKNNLAIIKNFNINDYDKNFKLQIKKNIKYLNDIRTNRGIRHHLKLPARGQRTKTNAKTKKSFKF
jgi:small subunit ribosomal protein S13